MKSAYMLDRFVQLKMTPNQFPASNSEIANWTDRILGLDINSIKGMTEGNSLVSYPVKAKASEICPKFNLISISNRLIVSLTNISNR